MLSLLFYTNSTHYLVKCWRSKKQRIQGNALCKWLFPL